VGKYVNLKDSYKSLHEALIHGGLANNCRVKLKYIDSEDIERKGPEAFLEEVEGVLVPGGFGSRGIEGKISAIRYVREKKKPFFGICLGMQMAVVEIARGLAGLSDANSSEFAPDTTHPVIDLMEEQRGVDKKGGTMRLGAYPCVLKKGTKSQKAYGAVEISERHRHRYEVNNMCREDLEKAGVEFSGLSPDGKLIEIMEYRNHPWFVGCQFHPEFKSSPASPHPLFRGFIKAVLHKRLEASKKTKKKKAVTTRGRKGVAL
jgi:CTP synthase